MSAAQRLPAGRRSVDGLSAGQVAEHQRRRILAAMAEVVAAKGYPATTVADVIAAAGVSRATFYDQFSDKLDCFLAAFDAASARVVAAVRPAGQRGPADTRPAFGDVIAGYLDVLVTDAAFASVFLVDIYAAGPAGVQRRATGQKRFAIAVAELVGATTPAEHFACEAFVAAVGALVTARIAAGDTTGVRELREPLTDLATRMLATFTT